MTEKQKRELFADDALRLLRLILDKKSSLYGALKEDADWWCDIDSYSEMELRLYLKYLDLLDVEKKQEIEK